MANVTKSVELIFKADNQTKKVVDNLRTNLQGLQKDFKSMEKMFDGFMLAATSLDMPQSFKPFLAVIKQIVNLPSENIEKIAKGLKEAAKVNLSKLGSFDTSKLEALSKIKANDIFELAAALDQLSEENLKKLGQINVKPIKDLSKLNSENLLDVAQVLELFKHITKLPNLEKFAISLKDISRLKPSDFREIVKGIKSISEVKFRDFSKDAQNIQNHVASIKSLTKAYARLNAQLSDERLKQLNKELNRAERRIDDTTSSTRRSRASFSQWAYAIGSASTGLSDLGTRLYGVTRGFSAVSKSFGVGLAAFTTFFTSLFALKETITDVAEFDDAIRAAGAVAQATAGQLEEFAEAARKMGEQTRYTATEAAGALKELAVTGLSVNESIAALPSTLDAAASAGIGIGEAADILTNIMTGYRKTVEDLPQLTDVLTASFTNSNNTLKSLNESFKQAGPILADAGVEFEETAAIISVLGDAGYRGSRSGRTLKNAIGRLLAPTRAVNKALSDYNLSAEGLIQANTNMETGILSLIGIFEDLRNANLSTGDAMRVFGKIAAPGVLAALGTTEEKMREMNQVMIEAEGTALRVAYQMEAGLGGSLRRLSAIWDEVGISIGKAMEDDIIDFIENLTKSIAKNKDTIVEYTQTILSITGGIVEFGISIADFIIEHDRLVKTLLVGISIFGLYKVAVSSAMASIVLSIKSFGAAIFFTNPYTIMLTAAITALITVLGGLYIAFNKIFPDYKKLAQQAKATASEMDRTIKSIQLQIEQSNHLDKSLQNNYNSLSDFSKAEKELSDLILNANISYESRVKLINKLDRDQKKVAGSTDDYIESLSTFLSKSANVSEPLIQALKKLSDEQGNTVKSSEELNKILAQRNTQEIVNDILKQNNAIEIQTNKIDSLGTKLSELKSQRIAVDVDDQDLEMQIETIKQSIINSQEKIKDYNVLLNRAFKQGVDNGIPLLNVLDRMNQQQNKSIEINKQLNEELSKQAEKVDIMQFNAMAEALEAQKKAAEKAHKEYNKLSSIRDNFVQTYDNMPGVRNIMEKLGGVSAKEVAEQHSKFKELEQQYQSYFAAIEREIAEFADKGKSLADINKYLKDAFDDPSLIDKFTESFKKYVEIQKEGKSAVEEFTKSSLSQSVILIEQAKSAITDYEKYAQQREEIEKTTQQAIQQEYINGNITKEQLEKSLSELTINEYKKRYLAAVDNFKDVERDYKALADDQKHEESEVTKQYQQAQKIKKDAFSDYVDSVNSDLMDLTDEQDQYSENINRANKRIYDTKFSLNTKIKKNEETLFNQLKELNNRHANTVIAINERLAKKKEELNKQETEVKSKANSDLVSLEATFNEKIRQIRIQNLSDSQKETSNRLAAYNFLEDAERQLYKAKAYNDKESLDASKNLLNQSLSIFESLNDQRSKIIGIKQVYEQLKAVNKVNTAIRLQEIEKEKQKAEQKAQDELNAEKKKYANSLNAYKSKSKQKMEMDYRVANNAIAQQEREIQAAEKKIAVIDEEIARLLLKNEIQKSVETGEELDYDKITESVKKAVEQTKNFADKMRELGDVKLDSPIDHKSFEKAITDLDAIVNKNNALNKSINKTQEVSKKAFEDMNRFVGQEYIDPNVIVRIKVNEGDVRELEGTYTDLKKQIGDMEKEFGHSFEDIEWDFKQTEISKKSRQITEKINKKPVTISYELEGKSHNIETVASEVSTIIDRLKKEHGDEIKQKINIDYKEEITNFKESMDKVEDETTIKKIEIDKERIQKDISDLELAIKEIDIETPDGLKTIIMNIERIDELIEEAKNKGIEIKVDTTLLDNVRMDIEVLDENLEIQRNLNIDVIGKAEIESTIALIDSIKDKTVKLTYLVETKGQAPASKKANGGYIQGYDSGGSVFKKLSSRFISQGSGNKDDVPAMLMKGEYVQRTAAVKKYGKDFMAKLNQGIIPKSIIKMFENGGIVEKNNLQSNLNYGITSMGNNLLSLVKSSISKNNIPAYAFGGYVNSDNKENVNLNFNFGNRNYSVSTTESSAKQLVKEFKNLEKRLR